MCDKLKAQLPSQGGEAVEVVGWTIAEPDGDGGHQLDIALGSDRPDFGVHSLMTVAQHQRIMAASVADPGAVAVRLELLEQIEAIISGYNDRSPVLRPIRVLLGNIK